jgi:hypothetical protein
MTSTVERAEGIQRTIRWPCATFEPEPPALVGTSILASMFQMRTVPTIDPNTAIDQSSTDTTTSISPEATFRSTKCKSMLE